METTAKITSGVAKIAWISHPTASYANFCYTEEGDLFINSDWWFFGYAWRSMGTRTFEEFMGQCNAYYVLGKLEINYRDTAKKKIPKHIQENLLLLLEEFIKLCSHNSSAILPKNENLPTP